MSIRLLIIESHAHVRQALVTRLASVRQFEVLDSGADLAEAQKLVAEVKPQVVILGLDRVRGSALRKKIDLLKNLAGQTAVIVLASYADESTRKHFLQAGADRYLLKDINTEQLIAEIEAIVAVHSL